MLKKILSVQQRIKSVMDFILLVFLGSLLIFMIILVMWQIISRAILLTPSTNTEEIVRFALIWLCVLGAVYGFSMKQHISITLLVDILNPTARWGLAIFSNLVTLGFSVVILLFGGLAIVRVAMIQSAPITQVPMGYIYMVLPLSGIYCSIYILFDLCRLVADKIKGAV